MRLKAKNPRFEEGDTNDEDDKDEVDPCEGAHGVHGLIHKVGPVVHGDYPDDLRKGKEKGVEVG